jgi:hypothetical protein
VALQETFQEISASLWCWATPELTAAAAALVWGTHHSLSLPATAAAWPDMFADEV